MRLRTCEDQRGATVIERDGSEARGDLYQGTVTAQFSEGRLRLTDITNEVVPKCDF
ncbi:hypothetical protein GCM10027418_17370 [Mariniluteicoccus endophyticus]